MKKIIIAVFILSLILNGCITIIEVTPGEIKPKELPQENKEEEIIYWF
jgi:uncharacterized protein YceK